MAAMINARKETLRLYRDIVRTARCFQWKDENGDEWGKVLQQSARREIEQNKNLTDREEISRLLLVGWNCLSEIQEKFQKEQERLIK